MGEFASPVLLNPIFHFNVSTRKSHVGREALPRFSKSISANEEQRFSTNAACVSSHVGSQYAGQLVKVLEDNNMWLS
jgi:hypothetical protein